MRYAVLALTVFLASCVTTQPRDYRLGFTAAPAAPKGHGLVYLYKIWQPKSEFDTIDVYANERLVVSLKQHQYTWLHLPVGTHRFTAHVRTFGPGYWIPPREIEINEGTTSLLGPLADIVLDSGYRFEPVMLANGRLLPIVIPQTMRVEGGRTWSYSDDGYVSDRLASFNYVQPANPKP